MALIMTVGAYPLLAAREERQVVERFGEAYRDYGRRVPRFLPRWGRWRHLAAVAAAAGSERGP
jgi:protein-S-isoprenylcysteine O-methyltransferase Ste14